MLHVGDCLDVLPGIADASVDAVVTDPPYSLSFMGREWDSFKPPAFQAWCEKWAAECLRVLKPGGHLLAFGGTRTYHRLACGIEDAGFEVRDSLHWIYGSGFPKSLDVSKAIDKAAGAERRARAIGSDGAVRKPRAMAPGGAARAAVQALSEPVTEDAASWEGWGTALKPAHEPIIVARKPLASSSTVAQNVLAYGTGALNVDGCRVNPGEIVRCGGNGAGNVGGIMGPKVGTRPRVEPHNAGRWPPNVLLGPEAAAELDRQSAGTRAAKASGGHLRRNGAHPTTAAIGAMVDFETGGYSDPGGAARFFPVFRYQAKASTKERPRLPDGTAHPTVKPVDLMRWLVRLVTPPGGLVLDPFAGTGTTGEACLREGFHCVLIERDPDALALMAQRLSKPIQEAR